MKTITVTCQKELDVLPSRFDEFTVIEIRSKETIKITVDRGNSRAYLHGNSSATLHENSSAYLQDNSSATLHENSSAYLRDNSSAYLQGNSSATLRDNSRATLHRNSSAYLHGNSSASLHDNSRATLHGNSSANAFLCSTVFVRSDGATINKLLDNSRAIFKVKNCKEITQKDETAKITEFKDLITPTFEQWLDRGYVVADDIYLDLVSQKTLGNVSIFEATNNKEETVFVARSGNKFAHGKTIEDAIKDLRFKISDRDTTKYEYWSVDDEKSIDELIEAYMTITGACSFGTKEFCDSIKLKDSYMVKDIFELTLGKFGNEDFINFNWSK